MLDALMPFLHATTTFRHNQLHQHSPTLLEVSVCIRVTLSMCKRLTSSKPDRDTCFVSGFCSATSKSVACLLRFCSLPCGLLAPLPPCPLVLQSSSQACRKSAEGSQRQRWSVDCLPFVRDTRARRSRKSLRRRLDLPREVLLVVTLCLIQLPRLKSCQGGGRDLPTGRPGKRVVHM
jgi:hypothetical protein